MTVFMNNEIDTNINKLDEMLEKLKLLEDKSNMIRFVTIKEFAKIRNCSLKIAQDIFNEQTFPSENYRKNQSCRIISNYKLVSTEKGQEECDQASQKIFQYKIKIVILHLL